LRRDLIYSALGVSNFRPRSNESFFIGWTGMRGVITLAAAMALPEHVDSGAPFPQRDILIFLSFSVILATLVAQGLSLPWIIRSLGLVASPKGEIQTSVRLHPGAVNPASKAVWFGTRAVPDRMPDSVSGQDVDNTLRTRGTLLRSGGNDQLWPDLYGAGSNPLSESRRHGASTDLRFRVSWTNRQFNIS
jgi:hypothetical protein